MNAGRLKMGAALIMTSPFIPMLFQGEEWGAATPFQYFTDHQEPKLGDAVREGRRKEFEAFGWNPGEIPDPQARDTFLASKLNWQELGQTGHGDLLDWHRKLIRLRRAEPSLSNGRLDQVNVRYDEKERWFMVERGPVSVFCNLAERTQVIPFSGSRRLLLASDPGSKLLDGKIQLPADSITVLRS